MKPFQQYLCIVPLIYYHSCAIFSLASFCRKIDIYLICFILPTGSVSVKASTGPVAHSSLYWDRRIALKR